jgi:hypothetical protein
VTKKIKTLRKNEKKTERKRRIKKRKFYVIIKGKRHFISPDLIERYHLGKGEKIPFSHLKVFQEK